MVPVQTAALPRAPEKCMQTIGFVPFVSSFDPATSRRPAAIWPPGPASGRRNIRSSSTGSSRTPTRAGPGGRAAPNPVYSCRGRRARLRAPGLNGGLDFIIGERWQIQGVALGEQFSQPCRSGGAFLARGRSECVLQSKTEPSGSVVNEVSSVDQAALALSAAYCLVWYGISSPRRLVRSIEAPHATARGSLRTASSVLWAG